MLRGGVVLLGAASASSLGQSALDSGRHPWSRARARERSTPQSLVAIACLSRSPASAPGMFSVPLVAFIQRAPMPGRKGRAVAFNNWVNFIALFLAAPFYQIVLSLDLPPTVAAAAAAVVLMGAMILYRGAVARLEFED
jgi:hypothetical protein